MWYKLIMNKIDTTSRHQLVGMDNYYLMLEVKHKNVSLKTNYKTNRAQQNMVDLLWFTLFSSSTHRRRHYPTAGLFSPWTLTFSNVACSLRIQHQDTPLGLLPPVINAIISCDALAIKRSLSNVTSWTTRMTPGNIGLNGFTSTDHTVYSLFLT